MVKNRRGLQIPAFHLDGLQAPTPFDQVAVGFQPHMHLLHTSEGNVAVKRERVRLAGFELVHMFAAIKLELTAVSTITNELQVDAAVGCR
jgi:hypothetical protein